MRQVADRSRRPSRTRLPAGRPGHPPTDIPRLIVIVIVLLLASGQVLAGQQAAQALQLLAGASAIGLEITRRTKVGSR